MMWVESEGVFSECMKAYMTGNISSRLVTEVYRHYSI